MISSYDVMGMQQGMSQTFMVANQYNQMMGSPYGPNGPPGHNMPAYSSFSYAGSETGYGLGTRAGDKTVGAMQGMYQAGSIGMTAAGAYAGYKVAGARGAFRGAMMAGGPLLGAGMLAGGHVFGNMMEGAEEQSAIYGTLGRNFQFSNGMSRTGRGFSRQDSKSISDFVSQMQSVPELMSSMGELNNIMSKVSQMGIMNGVRNAQDFQKRFKETVSTLKDISKIMETTMEGAVQFLEESRRSGMYSPAMIKQNMLQRQFTAGVTGMDQNQINNLQFMGSQISFGTGGLRGSGAQSALRSARQIGMANEMGLLTNDRIAELTGFDGAQGISAMATSMTDASQRMAQGGLGTAMSLALGKVDKTGRFTGGLDDELVQKVRMGGISKSELLSLARQKSSSRTAKISFKSNENLLRSEMASQVGAEGIAMELGDVLGGAGFSNPDALNLIMGRYGVDERQAKMISEMGRNLPEIQRELGSRAQTEGRRVAEQSNLKENYSNEAIKRKLFKKLENTFSEPFKHMGANISNAVGSYVDNFMDSLLDRYSTQITKEVSGLSAGSLGGSSASQAKLAAMIKGAGPMDLSPGPSSASFGDEMLDSLNDFRSNRLNRHDALMGLKQKGLAYERGDGIVQDSKEIAASKRYFGDLQQGKFGGGFLERIQNDNDFAGSVGGVSKKVQEVIREHGGKLKGMSQMEKVNFIKDKVKSGWFSKSRAGMISMEAQGYSIEDAIAFAQMHGKLGDSIGAVDFNKYAGELYGTGEFGSAGDLRKAQDAARGALSSKFGDQSSQVDALLNTDSKKRDLFLKASGGDDEAQSLLTKNLPQKEREKLMAKYGVDEKDLDQLQVMYGGAKGSNVSPFASDFTKAMNRSSFGGLAAQLRRQGIDMGARLEKSGLGGAERGILGDFAGKLSDLTSTEKLSDFLTKRSGELNYLFDSIGGLKGEAREKALSVLGEGASAAMGYGQSLARASTRKGGITKEQKERLPEELRQYIDSHAKGGVLSGKDAEELGKMARNRYYAGSLTAAGEAKKQDVTNFNKELLEKLNIFAQTTSQFANLVVQATPQLSDNVKKAQQAVSSSANMSVEPQTQSGG